MIPLEGWTNDMDGEEGISQRRKLSRQSVEGETCLTLTCPPTLATRYDS